MPRDLRLLSILDMIGGTPLIRLNRFSREACAKIFAKRVPKLKRQNKG
ncbi:MAG: hypothetical protein ACUVQ0_03290 [Thermoproteota archaeon]